MLGDIIVWFIVGLVVLWLGRSLYRTLSGTGGGCSCDISNCPRINGEQCCPSHSTHDGSVCRSSPRIGRTSK